jgi:hypothetical protein
MQPGSIEAELCETLSAALGISVSATEVARPVALGEAEWGAAQVQRHSVPVFLGSHSSGCVY